ncbi:squalene--hopene cyclase [Bacillus sp. 1P06AnD]|uniref:squalene--hopene cyclase n=1 Tax=Bacillus sp. 1P06AnD TaxID=3132208 RepID=UPI0039A09417
MKLHQVEESIQRRTDRIKSRQNADGSWTYIFQGPIMTDCFMIILLQALGKGSDESIPKLIKRLLSLQKENGSWSIYSDEKDGNLSATVQAYTALLLSGRFGRQDEEMKRAEFFISEHGGIQSAHFMTKMMLALNGLYKYPGYFYFPMTYFLLPPSFPFSLYHCSSYARVHLTPMIICMNKKFAVHHEEFDTGFFNENKNDQWVRDDREDWPQFFINEMKSIALTPLHLHKAGYKAAKKLMLDRIERNGTLYSYASSSFYMVYALLALGHKKNATIISKAIQGMKSYSFECKNGSHIQNSPSTVWDSALLAYSLQTAGLGHKDAAIQKATDYLMKKQQLIRGDWAVNAPNNAAGGWGFSDSNTFIPDNDDTSACLRALANRSLEDQKARKAWERGKHYLIHMQNKDGGWAAFEKDAYQPLLTHLPIENAKDALTDDSTADLTGRVLECLGTYGNHTLKDDFIDKSCDWLLRQQRQDGSWYGKWGICYLYGTWAAITGLRAVGVPRNHKQIMKSILWLEQVQRQDGGWGESCKSAEKEEYLPLPFSTPSQTAWAVDALLTVRPPDAPSIQKGIKYLIEHESDHADYPTGLGLPGGFYICYGSYNEIFPLLALGHYREKISRTCLH